MSMDFVGTHIRGEYREPHNVRHNNTSHIGRPSPPNTPEAQAQAERVTQRAKQLKQQFPNFSMMQPPYNQKRREIIDFLNANPGAEFTLEQKEDFAAHQKALIELQSNNKVTVTDVYVDSCSVPASTNQFSVNYTHPVFGGAGFTTTFSGEEKNGIRVRTVSVDERKIPNIHTQACKSLLTSAGTEILLSIPQISLQTFGRLFVCAENGGGEAVNANRNRIDIWESFFLINHNADRLVSGEVHHGDKVSFVTHTGFFMRAPLNAGEAIDARRPGNQGPGEWESFTIESKSGLPGALEDLEEVFIKDFQGFLLIADHGGGGGIHRSTNPGSHETFILCQGPKGLDPQVAPIWRPIRHPDL